MSPRIRSPRACQAAGATPDRNLLHTGFCHTWYIRLQPDSHSHHIAIVLPDSIQSVASTMPLRTLASASAPGNAKKKFTVAKRMLKKNPKQPARMGPDRNFLWLCRFNSGVQATDETEVKCYGSRKLLSKRSWEL